MSWYFDIIYKKITGYNENNDITDYNQNNKITDYNQNNDKICKNVFIQKKCNERCKEKFNKFKELYNNGIYSKDKDKDKNIDIDKIKLLSTNNEYFNIYRFNTFECMINTEKIKINPYLYAVSTIYITEPFDKPTYNIEWKIIYYTKLGIINYSTNYYTDIPVPDIQRKVRNFCFF